VKDILERARKRPALFTHMRTGSIREAPHNNPVLGPIKLFRAHTLCGRELPSTTSTQDPDKVNCPLCKEHL
jgi:hypothetical protein